jgi:hypothetical protein
MQYHDAYTPPGGLTCWEWPAAPPRPVVRAQGPLLAVLFDSIPLYMLLLEVLLLPS